jgi:ribulose-5-phosphate 4-epimerase/fuculose-1-phosphate aldolase
MPIANLENARDELARANRILTNEGVLDAFGHVSVRHPSNPDRFLLSHSLPPMMVGAPDILEFTLDSEPVSPTARRLYSERVIHGAIYTVRPDVNAICHHHSPSMLPFCVTRQKLIPLSQLGAVCGRDIPFWDSRDEFGDTDLLVAKPAQAASLARTLGANWLVLMCRHGATCVGTTLQEMMFRAVHSNNNAELQLRAMAIGQLDALSDGEIDLASQIRPISLERSWSYWNARST